jgi:hypothetical protein
MMRCEHLRTSSGTLRGQIIQLRAVPQTNNATRSIGRDSASLFVSEDRRVCARVCGARVVRGCARVPHYMQNALFGPGPTEPHW